MTWINKIGDPSDGIPFVQHRQIDKLNRKYRALKYSQLKFKFDYNIYSVCTKSGWDLIVEKGICGYSEEAEKELVKILAEQRVIFKGL